MYAFRKQCIEEEHTKITTKTSEGIYVYLVMKRLLKQCLWFLFIYNVGIIKEGNKSDAK